MLCLNLLAPVSPRQHARTVQLPWGFSLRSWIHALCHLVASVSSLMYAFAAAGNVVGAAETDA